jgi:trehalose 6-phosphate phosphatase
MTRISVDEVSGLRGEGYSKLEAFERAPGRRGVLLDFDGTLSPIVARPELAQIREGARDVLAYLVPRLSLVAVISGRTTAQLSRLVPVDGIRLTGMYGLGVVGDLPPGLAEAVSEAAGDVEGTRIEPKDGSVAVHFRAADDPATARAGLHDLLGPIARRFDYEVIEGKRVLELVPAGRPLKEGAVERIVGEAKLDAVLYAGDDVADLRAFAALDRMEVDGLVTVKVAVRGPESPRDLLETADIVVDGPAGLVVLLGGL